MANHHSASCTMSWIFNSLLDPIASGVPNDFLKGEHRRLNDLGNVVTSNVPKWGGSEGDMWGWGEGNFCPIDWSYLRWQVECWEGVASTLPLNIAFQNWLWPTLSNWLGLNATHQKVLLIFMTLKPPITLIKCPILNPTPNPKSRLHPYH